MPPRIAEYQLKYLKTTIKYKTSGIHENSVNLGHIIASNLDPSVKLKRYRSE